jgi:hypothetical protein
MRKNETFLTPPLLSERTVVRPLLVLTGLSFVTCIRMYAFKRNVPRHCEVEQNAAGQIGVGQMWIRTNVGRKIKIRANVDRKRKIRTNV